MDNLIIRKTSPEDAEKILEFLNQIGGESDKLCIGYFAHTFILSRYSVDISKRSKIKMV